MMVTEITPALRAQMIDSTVKQQFAHEQLAKIVALDERHYTPEHLEVHASGGGLECKECHDDTDLENKIADAFEEGREYGHDGAIEIGRMEGYDEGYNDGYKEGREEALKEQAEVS